MATIYAPIMGNNFNAKFAILADSDGNADKDSSYNYPNITHNADGLLYQRPASVGNKINYYVFAADSWGARPDGISSEGLTLSDLSGVKLSGSISASYAWITVYTEPKNDSYNKAFWYRSRYNFTDQYLTKTNFNGSGDVTVDLSGWENLNTNTTNKSETQSGDDKILAIVINTASGESEAYELLISNVELLLNDGSTKAVDFRKEVDTRYLNLGSIVSNPDEEGDDFNILPAIQGGGAADTVQTEQGLVSENLGKIGNKSSGQKINHYIWAADIWGVRESLYSAEGLKMKDLDSLVLKGINFEGGNNPSAFVRIYTISDGDEDYSWYKSNLLVKPSINSNGDLTFTLGLSTGNYQPIGTSNGDSLTNASNLPDCADEDVLAISVQTGSTRSGPFTFTIAGAELHLEDGSTKAIDFRKEIVRPNTVDITSADIANVVSRHNVKNLSEEQNATVAKVVKILDGRLDEGTALANDQVEKIANAIKTAGVRENQIQLIPEQVDNSTGPVTIQLIENCALVIFNGEVTVIENEQTEFIVSSPIQSLLI